MLLLSLLAANISPERACSFNDGSITCGSRTVLVLIPIPEHILLRVQYLLSGEPVINVSPKEDSLTWHLHITLLGDVLRHLSTQLSKTNLDSESLWGARVYTILSQIHTP